MLCMSKVKWFKQINQDQRIEIYALLKKWFNKSKIARAIWVHHSTIWRELERNSIDYGRWNKIYKPIEAEKKRIKRRQKANHNHIKLIKNNALRSKIHNILSDESKQRWPDEILWRLKLEWRKVISTSTLYSFIRNNTTWDKFLRHKNKWYKKRKWKVKYEKIKWVKKIHDRLEVINNRERIWDWEADTVVSCKGYKGWLLTLFDRKTRYWLIKKVGNLKANTLYLTMAACLNWEIVKSITSDNWSEFADLSKLQTDLNITCYTTHPYCSFEKWTNEKHNWFIRRFIPKWSNIMNYSDEEILKIQNTLNHKPRKCLDYRTPYEVYYSTTLSYLK